MDEKITQLKSPLDSKLSEIQNLVDLDKLRVEFLGKKGSVTSLLKGMKDLSNEERKEFGKKVNELKQNVANTIESKTKELKQLEIEQEINSMPQFDIT
ncbi:MAG: phenylalanine--tRNA ligase subunit alpha, partial [Ruminococcus sp.]|nr:phenylalanine--tRNA ligase subunit alpha [Ruminococcus sp.]